METAKRASKIVVKAVFPDLLEENARDQEASKSIQSASSSAQRYIVQEDNKYVQRRLHTDNSLLLTSSIAGTGVKNGVL